MPSRVIDEFKLFRYRYRLLHRTLYHGPDTSPSFSLHDRLAPSVPLPEAETRA